MNGSRQGVPATDCVRLGSDADAIVIATTTNGTDEPVAALGKRLGIPVYRGPQHDVLARYHGAAHAHGADLVVRVTSDCPVIDPGVIDRVIGVYLERRDAYDYVSNTLQRTYPTGMDTEVFPASVLDEAYREAVDAAEREHVTPFIYRRPGRYRIAQVMATENASRHRWTVDTPEDLEFMRQVYSRFDGRDDFSWKEVLVLVHNEPQLMQINARVQHKTLKDIDDRALK